MNIDGQTGVCGLIGNPVAHTLSPVIHNTLAQKLGHNMVYVPLKVDDTLLSEAIQGAFALNLLGINVTVPYKEKVLSELTQIDELAEQIGAVNTLVRTESGFKGYNTDMPGLYRALCSESIQIEGKDIILLGAGGVARAVAFLCASKQVSKVYMLNRSVKKAQQIADEVNGRVGRVCIYPMSLAEHEKIPDGKFIAIQATSVGLYPDTEAVVIEDDSFYQKIKIGYDLIYKPSQTKFMKLVQRNGGVAYHGLKMLLYQGIIAYELWNKVEVSDKIATRVYEALKEATGITQAEGDERNGKG